VSAPAKGTRVYWPGNLGSDGAAGTVGETDARTGMVEIVLSDGSSQWCPAALFTHPKGWRVVPAADAGPAAPELTVLQAGARDFLRGVHRLIRCRHTSRSAATRVAPSVCFDCGARRGLSDDAWTRPAALEVLAGHFDKAGVK
jgi:hypothetical protein